MTLTRKRDKSAAKGGSRKESVGAAPARRSQNTSASGTEAGPPSKRKIWIAASAAAVIVAGIGLGLLLRSGIGSGDKAPVTSASTFVGSNACAGCHQAETKLWRGSHHQEAMDHATDTSVVGDFKDASFDHYGVHSRFFRQDGKFLVETDGSDGKLATFEVKYTFGVY